MSEVTESDALALARQCLERWRAEGAEAKEPQRFRWLEAMTRKTAGHTGVARRVLEARVTVLVTQLRERLNRTKAPEAGPSPGPAGGRSPLGLLLTELQREDGTSALEESETGIARPERTSLRTVERFRRTWTLLASERRLNQALSKVPDNAGPLHSGHLLHRTLRVMQETSPEYLAHFLAQVDTLLALEQATGVLPVSVPSPRAPVAQTERGRKASRTASRRRSTESDQRR